MPDSVCPLGAGNYTQFFPSGLEALGDELCDPRPGVGPTLNASPREYDSAVEQADGTFLVQWNDLTLPAGSTSVLRFPSLSRLTYQENFAPAAPVLTGDSYTNVLPSLNLIADLLYGFLDPRVSHGRKG